MRVISLLSGSSHFSLEERMAQRVQIILEDDYDGGTAARRFLSDWTGRSTKSTCRPGMPPGSATRWRHGWHTPGRRAVGVSGRPRRPARRAPVTSVPGHRPKALMSAVAAESPRRYARRTRRLTLDVSPESPAPRLFSSDPPHRSLVSNGCLPCALGEQLAQGASVSQGVFGSIFGVSRSQEALAAVGIFGVRHG